MRVLISGGSGFLGRALTKVLLENPTLAQVPEVTWLSRSKTHANASYVTVLSYDELTAEHEFDVVVNLAGAGIADKRWSSKRKQVLRDSRLLPTQALVDWMGQVHHKPRVFVSGSAIGWYGAQGDTPLDESSSARDEFQHRLCDEWEKVALEAKEMGIRTVIVRTGVVLHSSGGMLGKLMMPFKLGLGGRLGTGQQILSWISLEDWVSAVSLLIENAETEGVYNLTAPQPVSNADFTHTFARVIKRPAILPAPAAALKLGLGEMSTLLLDGQRVLPKRLQALGFQFQHETLSQVFQSL